MWSGGKQLYIEIREGLLMIKSEYEQPIEKYFVKGL